MTSCMRTWKDGEFKAAYIRSPCFGVPQVKISIGGYLSSSLLWKSVVSTSFWILLLGAEGPMFVSRLLWQDRCESTEEWKLHFAGKCLGRTRVLRVGKWTKRCDWCASLKCKSRLAVAQPQENASCYRTLSLPSDTRIHMHENDHFIIYFFFGVMISSWE